MTTIKLNAKGVIAARAIRDERNAAILQATALQETYTKEMDALQLAAGARMKALWAELLVIEGLHPDHFDRYSLDMGYLDEHDVGFLRVIETATADEALSSLESFNAPTKH